MVSNLQRPPGPGDPLLRVAFQGVAGAFGHEALLACLPHARPLAFDTFEAAIAAVVDGRCERAFLPVRNSIAGAVPEVADLLPRSGLFVVSELAWPVHHQLMAQPGVELDAVRVVASHPMALKQCRRLLEELGARPSGVRVEAAFDTAGAARDLAAAPDPTRAVIASRAAADLYGLQVLRADVEDTGDNTTWFALVRAGG